MVHILLRQIWATRILLYQRRAARFHYSPERAARFHYSRERAARFHHSKIRVAHIYILTSHFTTQLDLAWSIQDLTVLEYITVIPRQDKIPWRCHTNKSLFMYNRRKVLPVKSPSCANMMWSELATLVHTNLQECFRRSRGSHSKQKTSFLRSTAAKNSM